MFTLALVHPPDSRDRAMQEQYYLTFLIEEAYFTCDAQTAIHRKLRCGRSAFRRTCAAGTTHSTPMIAPSNGARQLASEEPKAEAHGGHRFGLPTPPAVEQYAGMPGAQRLRVTEDR